MSVQPRIGLVGIGPWGALILRDLLALGASVTAVARSGENLARCHAAAVPVVATVPALPADLDGYIVATPVSNHAEVIRTLLPRGRPIYTEKPLTDDLPAARALAEEAEGRLFVMDKWRYHHGILALAGIARSGELGPVESVRCVRVDGGMGRVGLPMIWRLLPHDLSIALEIMGHIPEPRFATLQYAGGDIVGMIAVLGDRGELGIDVSYAQASRRRRTTAVFAGGAAELPDAYADHILVWRRGAEAPERRSIPTGMPLEAELAAFLAHLAGGPAPKSSATEAAMIVDRMAALISLAGMRTTR